MHNSIDPTTGTTGSGLLTERCASIPFDAGTPDRVVQSTSHDEHEHTNSLQMFRPLTIQDLNLNVSFDTREHCFDMNSIPSLGITNNAQEPKSVQRGGSQPFVTHPGWQMVPPRHTIKLRIIRKLRTFALNPWYLWYLLEHTNTYGWQWKNKIHQKHNRWI